MKYSPIIMLIGVVLAGCNHHPVTPFETTVISEQADDFESTSELKVDILWVIDNSGSMCDEQQNLRDNFELFVDALIFNGIDFNLAVVTTDMRDPLQQGRFQNVASTEQGEGCKIEIDVSTCPGIDGSENPSMVISSSNPRYQNGEGEPDLETIKHDFGCRATAGSKGHGFEMGLESARRALSPSLLSTHNAGFLRDDAMLAVVFLTDENDCSRIGIDFPNNGDECEWYPELLTPMQEYIDFFTGLKRGPDGQPQPDRVVMAGIVGPDSGIRYSVGQSVQQSCFQEENIDSGLPDDVEGADSGYRYIELINAFENRGQASICESPFEAALATISDVIPEAVAPCLRAAPTQCTSDTDCGDSTCEVRGRTRVCADLRIQVEIERDTQLGSLENRSCTHLGSDRLRCILLEDEDYALDYASSCGASGIAIDLFLERRPNDTLIARYPRLNR